MKTQGSVFVLKCLQERLKLSRADEIFSEWQSKDPSFKISGFRAFSKEIMDREEFEACRDWIDSLIFIERIEGIDFDIDQMKIDLSEMQNINAKLLAELNNCKIKTNQYSNSNRNLIDKVNKLNTSVEDLARDFKKDQSKQCSIY